MATQTFSINAAPGIQAINQIIQAFARQNAAVQAGVAIYRLFNQNANQARVATQQLGQSVHTAATQIQAGTAATRAHNTATNTMVQQARQLRVQILQVRLAMLQKNNALNAQTRATEQHNTATGAMGHSLTEAVIKVHIMHRALSLLSSGIRQSVDDAGEFQRRIAEIKTVSIEMRNGMLKSAKTTGEWSTELISLSRNFGIPVLEQARATYEALSNQVVTAGNSTNFMASEMKLALTTVATLDKAVEVTSTVINAYHKSASEAERINAVLFRGVDLGRFKLEELGSSFGRVSLLANQLGVSFEEVVGSLALLTRLGVQADVANTLLANTFNALVKPSKEMTAFLKSYGFASGEAAIKTLGWAKIFQILAKEIENGNGLLTELSTKFEDIRGLTGAAGLTGNFQQLADTIKEVSNAQEIYNEAWQLTIENLGVRGKVELEKFKQYFLIQFGLPLQAMLVRLSESFGGADKALGLLTSAITVAIGTYLGYRASILAVSVATSIYTGMVQANTAAQAANAAATAGANAARGAAVVGIGLLIGILVEVARQEAAAKDNMALFLAQLRSDEIEKNRKILEKLANTFAELAIANEEATREITQNYGNFFANLRKMNFALEANFEDTFKTVIKAVKAGFKIAVADGTKSLAELEAAISKSKTKLEATKEAITKLGVEGAERKFRVGIEGLGPLDAIRALNKERERLSTEALKAVAAGEGTLATELFKRVDELNREAVAKLRKLKEEADKVVKSTGSTTVGPGGITRRVGGVTIRVPFGGRGRGPTITTRDGDGIDTSTTATKKGFVITGKTASGPKSADAAKAFEYEKQILALVEAEAKLRADELKAREDFLKKETAALATKEAAAAKQKKHLEKFKEVVNEIDSFDPKRDPKELEVLLGVAKFQGNAAGIDFLVLREALQKAEALKTELQRKGGRDRQEEVLKQIEAETTARVEAQKKAFDELNKAKHDASSGRLAFSAEGIATTAEALKVLRGLKAKDAPNPGDLFQAPSATEVAKEAAIQKLVALGKAFRDLQDAEKSGGNTANALSKIKKAQDEVNTALEEFDRLGGPDKLKRTGILGALGLNEPDFVDGKVAAPGLAGDKPTSLLEKQKKLQEQYHKLANLRTAQDAAFFRNEAAKRKVEEQQLIFLQQKAAMEKAAADAAVGAGDGTVRVYKAINTELEKMLALLRAINGITGNAVPSPGPTGTRLPGEAFGGVGMDRTFANVADGESIMSRLATRQYAPFLRAIQTPSPALRRDNTVMNFGDITINAPQGTTSGQAAAIANQLIRLRRRGFQT